jgi:hypothetical protein
MDGGRMSKTEKKQHPHLGATYEVLEKNPLFAVQVKIPGVLPTTISGFKTRQDAEQWIERHKAGIAKGAPQRIPFNSRSKS